MQLSNKQQNIEHSEKADEEEEFSSFSSNSPSDFHDGRIDFDGFKVHDSFKEKPIEIVESPLWIPKLYEQYLNNVERKKKLSQAISNLKQRQLKSLRLQYDKQSSQIEEIIDIDEDSPEFEQSMKKYLEREEQLKREHKKYQDLKIMSVVKMMKTDEILMKTFEKFVHENKEIRAFDIQGNKVYVLVKERLRLRKMKMNMENRGRSKSSQDSEEGYEKEHQQHKYVIRTFSFMRDEKKLYSFNNVERSLEIGLISNADYNGIIHDKKNRFYAYEENRLVQIPSGKCIEFDKKIIFCQIRKEKMFVGTSDNIMRIYTIFQEEIKIQKIVSCFKQEDSKISHFALPNQPDIILFVEDGKRLCEFDFQNYQTHELSFLPEEVIFINQKLIVTENLIFKDYYSRSGNKGKATIIHNQELKKLVGKRKIVGTTLVRNQEFVVLDEGMGNLSIVWQNQKPMQKQE